MRVSGTQPPAGPSAGGLPVRRRGHMADRAALASASTSTGCPMGGADGGGQG